MHQNHQELLNSLWNLNSSPWNLDSIYLERCIFKSSRWVSGIKIQGHHQYMCHSQGGKKLCAPPAWSVLVSRTKELKKTDTVESQPTHLRFFLRNQPLKILRHFNMLIRNLWAFLNFPIKFKYPSYNFEMSSFLCM